LKRNKVEEGGPDVAPAILILDNGVSSAESAPPICARYSKAEGFSFYHLSLYIPIQFGT